MTSLNRYQRVLTFVFIFFGAMSNTIAQTSSGFTASNNQSDSKIELSWNISVTEAHRHYNPEIYFQIREGESKKEVFSERLDSINNYDSLSGLYTTSLLPSSMMEYEIRIIEYGPGNVLIDSVFAIGFTKSYQAPEVSANGLTPWGVELSLKSNSDYDTKMLLYRTDVISSEKVLLTVLDTSAKTYHDICNPLDNGSILNGGTYSYEVVSINAPNQDSISSVLSATQLTYLVDLTAQKNSSNKMILLQWSDLNSYVDRLVIKRDGTPLAEVNSTTNSFEDATAIPGFLHSYTLGLYVQDILKLTVRDSGNLVPNGSIVGTVFNSKESGDFTVPDVRIMVTGTVVGEDVTFETKTDELGNFEVLNIPYHTETSFTVSTQKDSINLETNNQEVTLNLNDPSVSVQFMATTRSEEVSKTVDLNTFVAESSDSQGHVKLSWDITSSDTVYYYIYRGDQLILSDYQVGGGTNDYIDLKGTPSVSYTYSMRAYSRAYQNASSKFDYYFTDTRSSTAQYPQPRAIAQNDFTSSILVNKASIEMVWSHPQGNIGGFRIYRNDELIKTLDKDQLSFQDVTGVGGTTYTYSMNCYLQTGDGQLYNSSKVFGNPINFPILRKPNNLTKSESNNGMSIITWEYNVDSDYNFDGFLILREYNGSTKVLGNVRRILPKTFQDASGVPRRNYAYRVQAYKENKRSFGIASNAITLKYPELPKLKSASAYVLNEGSIFFESSLDSQYSYLDIAIQNTAQSETYSIDQANVIQKSIVWNDYSNGNVDFALVPVKTVEGVNYFGNQTTLISVNLMTSGPYDLDTVTSLTATNDLTSHVKLCWEYPNFYVPEFHIYRDGYFLDKIEGVHKTYYDHSVNDNEWHVYQVQVQLGEGKSRMNGVSGRQIGKTRIVGSSYSLDSKQGVPNTIVKLYLPDDDNEGHLYYAETRTDSAGYYEFKNVSTRRLQSDRSTFKLSAENSNARFASNQKLDIFYDSIGSYVVDFVDTLPSNFVPSDSIAWPANIRTSANMQNHSVDIRWQAGNGNYTSFEVYRGLTLIATVPSNQTKYVVDNEGLPGYEYTYRIRVIWQKDRTTLVEGEYYAVLETYPPLLPVRNLNYTQVDDAIRVNWSHPSDAGIDYHIMRNGQLFDIVKTGQHLELVDATGVIGSVYKYSIIPVLSANPSIQGPEMSIVAMFPRVATLKSLNASTIGNGVNLSWQSSSNRSELYVIYCNGISIDTLFDQSTGNLNYEVYVGIPGALNVFEVAAGYYHNDRMIVGRKTRIDFIQDDLLAPSIYTNAVPSEDKVVLNATYFYSGLDGMEFWNSTDSLGLVIEEHKQVYLYSYDDKKGLPQITYGYKARVYSIRNDVKYYSDFGSIVSTQFPELSPPTQVVAKDSNGIYRILKWSHNREDITFNVVKYKPTIASSSTAVPGNERQYLDDEAYFGTKISYGVQAVLTDGLSEYLSNYVKSNSLNGQGNSLYAWGRNQFGQIGNNGTTNQLSPVVINDNAVWVQVVAGYYASYAIKDDGSLWAWGNNGYGQLGNGGATPSSSPVQIGTDLNWKTIISGPTSHTVFAFKKDGSLWCWGSNNYGQLGQGHTTQVSSPVLFGSAGIWKEIATGGVFTVGIKLDGTLWTWGRNQYGSLGQGSLSSYTSSTPAQVGTASDWNIVSAGQATGMAIKANGAIWGWGDNIYGTIGIGNYNDQASPVQAGTGTDWINVSCGAYHTLAQNGSGTYSTGHNYHGQLINGSTANSSTFLSCSNSTNISQIATGAFYSHVKINSRFYGQGNNSYGQLGNGGLSTNLLDVLRTPSQSWKDITGGFEHTIGLISNPALYNFEASEGIGTKVFLTWNALNTSLYNSVLIYRDGILIANEDASKTRYVDLDAIPGMKHVYSAKAERTNNTVTSITSDIGWREASAIVKGSVISLIGSQPVPDVNIYLKISTDDGNYYDTTISNGNGNFRFDKVYAGHTARATVTAKYLDHDFVQDTLFGDMDVTVTSLGIGTFVDKTANLISGTVTRQEVGCPLDSIPVILLKHYASSSDIEELKYTDEKGDYTYSVNPYEDDLISFELQLIDTVVRGSDTFLYDWNRNNVIIDKSSVSSATPQENFQDRMSVQYDFSVRNSCNTYPGVRFSIDIESIDGCYRNTITSNDNGVFATQDLPPLEYVVTVGSASPLTSDVVPVIEYLKVRPIRIDLRGYNTNQKRDSTKQDLFLKKIEFSYHNTPQISLTKGSGIGNVACNTDIYFVRGIGDPQRREANIDFAVSESHRGSVCHVNEGYLIVKNGASDTGDVRINLDVQTRTFPRYTFKPGLPETIAPYYKTMSVEYHTKTGFVSQEVYQILVTGKAAQPGSDVIVSKEEGKGIQMPLAVLRDPPGDNSYSYLEKGVETTKSFSVDRTFGGSFTLSASNQFSIAGIGVEVSASAGVGGSEGNRDEIVFSQTTTERFETSAESDIQNSSGTEYFVGDNADIIMGTGLALKYGIVESINYDETDPNCNVTKSTEIGISPDKLTTTWTYTVSHIEALISEYENTLSLIRSGAVEISTSSGDKPRDSSFYRTLIDNWKGVLDYHKSKTLPHYNLCSKSVFNSIFDKSKVEPISRGLAVNIKKSAASFQEECFCAVAGTYDGSDTFSLNPTFKWTDDALQRYRVARKRINELSEYHKRLEKKIVAGPGYTPPSLAKFGSNLTDWVSSLTQEDDLYAENVTFSGQASIEKSFSTAFSSTQAYTQQIYGEASLYAGIFFKTDLEVSTWGGVGAGVEVTPVTLLEGEIKGGLEVRFDFNIENSVESSTTTTKTSGYVLGDDDAGDQFSVTVIKGLEPMHTPYFELFAGRSSCPYEPGTIPRDQPEIQLEYSDGSPFENNILRDVDVEEPAYYSLKLVNKAPEIFNEYRYYNLVQAANSNQNGAQLTADGSGQYYPLVYKVKSGGSTYTGFYANKAGISYDYPDLNMQLIPTCLDEYSDLTNGFDGAELHMEAYFNRPCSDISILSPTDNWRIFKSRDEFGAPSERLQVQIGDYDPYNEFLEKVSLQYRRIGSSVWVEIPGLSISKDSLQTYYELFKTTYRDPAYNFIWDVQDRSEIIDGEYELQAIVHCGIEGIINSNIVRGTIDRSSLALFGTPKPTDGVLNIGENVQVIFNEPIECGYERKDSHYVFVKKSGKEVLDFTPICNGNSIIYEYNGDLSLLDKQIVEMMVFEVQDLNGNTLEDTIKYEFMVSNSPIAVQPQAYAIDMYKGDVKQLEINLVNTGTALARLELSKLGTPNQLLNITNINDSIYGNSSLRYTIALNAKGIDIGTYNYSVSIDVSTFSDNYGTIEVPVQVNVLAEAPDWIIPFGKSQSTIVVCNFKMDNVQSIDTLDQIAITIDGEVRGYDNIYKSQAGNNLYYAVINVQGDPSDQGKEFQYRIWNASQGAEYDGYITGGAITFNGGIYGTTLNPRIIEIETEWDSVRYIPLIQGWNWLAFNYQKQNMSVDDMISGLSLEGGEIIKTLSQQAIYNDSTNEWFATGSGLNAINTAHGYMLYLHKDDVLRVSGKNADLSSMSIINGWSLIGNPFQENIDINNVFQANSDLKNGAVLKTGGAINKASVLEGGSWTGGITEYETNQSYMIKNSEATVLKLKKDDVSNDQFEYNMTILGSVLFDGGLLHGDGDYVIAEIDGELRGKGIIEEVQASASTYMLNMFIYGDTSDIGKLINFKIYRANSDEYYTAFTNDSVYFNVNDHKGGPNAPYWFANKQESLGVGGFSISSDVKIFAYPNPFRSQINIELETQDNGLAKIKLYDLFGRVVQSTEVKCLKGENKLTIDTGVLSNGVYIMRVEMNGRITSHKLLKQ